MPWITNSIKKSIKIKDRLYKNILQIKDAQRKNEIYDEFKQYRNYINISAKKSKANNSQQFFEYRKKNMQKTRGKMEIIININNT